MKLIMFLLLTIVVCVIAMIAVTIVGYFLYLKEDVMTAGTQTLVVLVSLITFVFAWVGISQAWIKLLERLEQ